MRYVICIAGAAAFVLWDASANEAGALVLLLAWMEAAIRWVGV